PDSLFFHIAARRLRRPSAAKARCYYFIATLVNFSFKHGQPLLMAGLIGVDLCSAVERISRLHIVALLAVEIDQLEKRIAVVSLSVCGVELVGEKLKHKHGWPVASDDVLHHRKNRASLAFAALKVL